MATALAAAHVRAQAKLREITATAVVHSWDALPGYDRADVAPFLDDVIPIVTAGQRQSAAMVEAFIARAMKRGPIGVDLSALSGAALRNGTPAADVYTRPFITTWKALGDGHPFDVATAIGRARASMAAATDVQLAMRAAAGAVGTADPAIQRFERVADPGACDFCASLDGAILETDAALEIHPYCGCSIEPLDEARPITDRPKDVAVHDHGELGPVIGAPGDHFTTPASLGLPEYDE